MRASSDTDRTHVAVSSNSMDHLDILEEKITNESRHQHNQHSDVSHEMEASSSETGHEHTTPNSDMSSIGGRDIEKGDEVADQAKAEAAKKEAIQQKDPNLIEWDGPDDPENPMNWRPVKKWTITLALGFMTLCVTFASSVFSNATVPVAKLYHVSTETTTLGTSLFVLGFAVGPLVCIYTFSVTLYTNVVYQ